MNHQTRRNFLQMAGGATLARLGMVNAMAQSSATDYKALVCVFLAGGNDGHNTIVPQTAKDYESYKVARSSLALPDGVSKLMPVVTRSGVPYALNDALGAIHPLWAQGKLAVVANVGMLIRPVTRTEYLNKSVAVPTNLFSHSDQVAQTQSGVPTGAAGTGWAGRVADAVDSMNTASPFPSSISFSGPALFGTGSIVQTAAFVPGRDPSMVGLDVWPQSATDARKAALSEILALDSGLAMVQSANKVRRDALDLAAMLKNVSLISPLLTRFPDTYIGRQMQDVARIIKARAQTGLRRQIFFCLLGGFDTHGSQNAKHWELLKQAGDAMDSLYRATDEMGVSGQVTTFTQAEFGRTLESSGAGSEHGWGNHHLVMGGAVRGGDLYGRFPTLALGGPDDSSERGALIPTTSNDQYGATMASWFGLTSAQLASVFPNLANFSAADLGFLS